MQLIVAESVMTEYDVWIKGNITTENTEGIGKDWQNFSPWESRETWEKKRRTERERSFWRILFQSIYSTWSDHLSTISQQLQDSKQFNRFLSNWFPLNNNLFLLDPKISGKKLTTKT